MSKTAPRERNKLLSKLILAAGIGLLSYAGYIAFNFQLPSTTPVAVQVAEAQNPTLRKLASNLEYLSSNTLQPQERKQASREIQSLLARFDQTLATLQRGGSMPGPDGEPITIPDFNSAELSSAVGTVHKDWQPMKQQFISLLRALNRPGTVEIKQITEALLTALTERGEALKQGNETILTTITDRYQQQRQQAMMGALLPPLGVIGALVLLWFWLAGRSTPQQRSKPLSTQQASSLMRVLDGAMLVFDRDQVISPHFTSEAATLLGKNPLAGFRLYEVMAPLIPTDLAPALNKYIELLFDPAKVESLIISLNPLESFEAKSVNDGTPVQLGFKFRRLVDEGEISGVLLTIKPLSPESIESEAQVPATSPVSQLAAVDEPLSVIDSLLKVEGEVLQSFAHSMRQSLERINDVLRSELPQDGIATEALKAKAESMLIEMHRLKGDFGALELLPLFGQAQNFEDIARSLTAAEQLSGDDFLPLTIKLKTLMSYADAIDKLALRFGHDEVPTVETKTDRWQHLRVLTQRVAEDENKQVELATAGLNEYPLNDVQRELVNDICIQLLRNAVVHGIETPAQRKALGKPPAGRVDINLTRISANQLELSIRDDGGGIDFEGIRQRAAEKGLVTADKIAQWNNRQLFSLLFRAEFSTARVSSAHAGQGVGLNVIRQRVKSVGGEIAVQTRSRRYSQFKILLPVVETDDTVETQATLSCAS